MDLKSSRRQEYVNLMLISLMRNLITRSQQGKTEAAQDLPLFPRHLVQAPFAAHAGYPELPHDLHQFRHLHLVGYSGRFHHLQKRQTEPQRQEVHQKAAFGGLLDRLAPYAHEQV